MPDVWGSHFFVVLGENTELCLSTITCCRTVSGPFDTGSSNLTLLKGRDAGIAGQQEHIIAKGLLSADSISHISPLALPTRQGRRPHSLLLLVVVSLVECRRDRSLLSLLLRCRRSVERSSPVWPTTVSLVSLFATKYIPAELWHPCVHICWISDEVRKLQTNTHHSLA